MAAAARLIDDAEMPELPEVEGVRRELERSMRGKRIRRVLLRRPDLRRPFPAGFASRLQGRTIRAVERRGKYLLVRLSSRDTLIAHLGMSGSFRIERAMPSPLGHDHVLFELSTGAWVIYNDPRRFGMMDLLPAGAMATDGGHPAMGPEPLGPQFGAATLARACAGKKPALKIALLDQRIVAGLGNIYASEALYRSRLSPLRRASTIATSSGLPRPHAFRLASAIKAVLRRAIAHRNRPYRGGRFLVYEREGEPCLRRGCGGTIRRITQAGRSTFYCPTCQR